MAYETSLPGQAPGPACPPIDILDVAVLRVGEAWDTLHTSPSAPGVLSAFLLAQNDVHAVHGVIRALTEPRVVARPALRVIAGGAS